MIDVAIVGAGELGGSLAHVLAQRGHVRRVQLVDPAGQVAAGKALDIMQAGPVQAYCTPVAGASDISRIAGASIVVVADPAKPGGADDLLTLKQILQMAAGAVVVGASAEHRTLIERGVRELGFSRRRLLGSAPEALAASVRALVALQIDGSASDVALAVLGAPPSQAVVAWDDATIGGLAAARVLDEPALRRLAAQVALLWPPGPHALAHAAAEVVAALCGRSRRLVSCFVAPDDALGRRSRAVALPVRIGIAGITSVEQPTLSVSAQVALDTAMQL